MSQSEALGHFYYIKRKKRKEYEQKKQTSKIMKKS